MPSAWEWWAGSFEAVEDDGCYDLGCWSSREKAIAGALRETAPGDSFYIIEARCSTADKFNGAEFIPFTHRRNREFLTNGPQMLEVANV